MKLPRLMRVADGDRWHARTEPHPELETWGSLHPELWAELRDEAARFWRFVERPIAVAREDQEADLAERIRRARAAPVGGRLPDDWLVAARAVPVEQVFEALGVPLVRGRWGRCPACPAETDSGGRGIVGRIRKGWICNACGVSGDGIAAVAYVLNGSFRVTPAVGRWFFARRWA